MNTQRMHWMGWMALLVWMGCEPFEEDGIDLPGPPEVNADWYFLPDTVDGVIGIDSNTVVFEAEAMEEVFMHLWDFGNGKTSDLPVDTMIYYAEGLYEISYQGHGAGGMHSMQDSIQIERTLELPCEGVLASLTGCDTPKSWKLSQEAGSVSVGPEPLSGEWYASPANEIVEFQADDRWQLSEDGVFTYLNNGGTQNPFEGYVETLMTVAPSTYALELDGGEYSNSPHFVINGLTTESAELCGFMGVWDSGPDYNIVEITEDRMVLTVRQQNGDCTAGEGWFTLTFVTAF